MGKATPRQARAFRRSHRPQYSFIVRSVQRVSAVLESRSAITPFPSAFVDIFWHSHGTHRPRFLPTPPPLHRRLMRFPKLILHVAAERIWQSIYTLPRPSNPPLRTFLFTTASARNFESESGQAVLLGHVDPFHQEWIFPSIQSAL